MRTFAINLNMILRERGLTKKALSEATGIPQSTLSEWCNGRTPTLSESIIKLTQYLGVTLEYMVTGKNAEERLLQDLIQTDNAESFIQIHKGTYRITVEKKTHKK